MPPEPFGLSFSTYLAFFPETKANSPRDHADFAAACVRFGITTPERMADFCANVAHESRGRTQFEESFRYRTPERLREVFPKYFKTPAKAQEYFKLGPKAIASRVYALRMGNGSEASADGWRYRGGGDIQLTGAANYIKFGQKLGIPLWSNPDLARTPKVGALIAGAFWEAANCNSYSDAGDFDGVCDVINLGHKSPEIGDSNGFPERKALREKFRAILGLPKLDQEAA